MPNISLSLQIQEFCYDNQNFLKCFNKIILLFYKTEVLSEEVILKWYKDGHAPKGWTVFMDQMKKFVEWLEQAESGEIPQVSWNNKDLETNCFPMCGTWTFCKLRAEGSKVRNKFGRSFNSRGSSMPSPLATGSTGPRKVRCNFQDCRRLNPCFPSDPAPQLCVQ